MYRLINVNKDDVILDAACGSGAFLVKAMCNMISEAGGINTVTAKNIKTKQLYGIEFDREIYALACANMLIHKDGKTNLTQLDSRTEEACEWIRSKPITKVLMNPPFENKYGCIQIVKNVLDNVQRGTMCAFILPEKKLEKVSKTIVNRILQKHTLKKIIKLPDKTFSEGVTTSVFIFEAGIPQNDKQIFACYIEEDGLITVKNQGRHDIKNKWQGYEDYWVDIIHKQSGDDTIQWISPKESLSYQVPQKPFEIYESDFRKTAMDYILFENGIDSKEFSDKILNATLYASNISINKDKINICISKDGDSND
jgi:type I restriction-modification system DNA methylase subunit